MVLSNSRINRTAASILNALLSESGRFKLIVYASHIFGLTLQASTSSKDNIAANTIDAGITITTSVAWFSRII